MAKQKYRSAATGGRFKNYGQGLRVAEDRIKEQRKTEIDAITLAKYQHQEASSNFISGMADAQRFEMQVLGEKQKLENQVREHKYNALVKKANTDVKRLEDEAKAKQKTADWWADFAPKFAKNLGTLATGTLQFADAYRGQKQWEALKESGILDELTDQKEAINSKIFANVTKDSHTGDPDENNTLHDTTFKVSTHWASKRLAKWYKENKQLVRSDVIAAFEASGGTYGEENAIEIQKTNAYQLLTQLGISPTSQGGKEILEEAIKIGTEDRKTFSNVRKVGETETRISDQLKNLKTLKVGTDEFLTNFHQLANLQKNGYFKTDTGISTPYDNPRSIADGLELAYKSYIDSNLDNIDINALLSLDIPNTGTGEKSSFENKHPLRADDIREYYLLKKTKQLDDLNNKREAKGLNKYNKYKKEYDNDAWLFDDNGKPLTNADGSDLTKEERLNLKEQWKIKTINLIASDRELTDKSRSLAYTLVGFDIKNHDIAVEYARIQTDIFNGDVEDALKTYNALDKQDKEKMAPLISIFKDLNESGYVIAGEPGFQGLFKSNRQLLLQGQKLESVVEGRTLTQNAEEKLAEINHRVFEKYKFFLAEFGGPGNEKRAAQAANDWIFKEWEIGALTENDDKYQPNHWLRRSGGDTKQGYIFDTVADTKANRMLAINALATLEERRNAAKEGEIVVIGADALNLILSKSPNHEVLVSGFNANTHSLFSLFAKEEVVTTESLRNLAIQIQNAKNLNLKYRKGKYLVDFDIPENIHILADHFTFINEDGKVEKPGLAYVVNKILEQRHNDIDGFPDVQITKDDKDLIQLVKNDRRGYKPINAYGIEKYQDGIAITGKIPQKKYIRQYIEGELDIMQLFAEHTGIGLTQNIDSNGVMTYTFSGKNDSKNYLENGGLDMPSNMTPVELMYAMGFPELVSERAQQMKKGNRGFLGWRSLVDYATADLLAGTLATDLDDLGY